jgi:hypothetical protein
MPCEPVAVRLKKARTRSCTALISSTWNSVRVREAPQLAEEVAYAFVPGDRPLKWQGGGNELDLRRGHFQVRLDIAAIERRECPSYHLYVLLRHRPSQYPEAEVATLGQARYGYDLYCVQTQ